MKKYLCYSDTHFNFTFPWTRYDFCARIAEEKPSALLLHGDIACGITLPDIMHFLARKLPDIPIYFVVGNHDHYSHSLNHTTKVLQELCKTHPTLIWLNQESIIPLTDGVALIGVDNWYDARLGDPVFLNYNLDWMMIDDFRALKSLQAKLSLARKLADQYSADLQTKLERALLSYKTVYIVVHVPPWREAVRSLGSPSEQFWLPYNINYHMGLMIEETMLNHPNQNVVVLAGHTHVPAVINVAHNIECIVQRGKYLGEPTEHNCLFI